MSWFDDSSLLRHLSQKLQQEMCFLTILVSPMLNSAQNEVAGEHAPRHTLLVCICSVNWAMIVKTTAWQTVQLVCLVWGLHEELFLSKTKLVLIQSKPACLRNRFNRTKLRQLVLIQSKPASWRNKNNNRFVLIRSEPAPCDSSMTACFT